MELCLDSLITDAENFTLTENDSYIETYPEFIKYFQELEMIESSHLVISAHFVYGWMPTIIQLDTSEKGRVLFLLNAVRSDHLLTADELLIIKKAINNSLVGASKLLHFINPSKYAIWDSRIYRYVTGKKSEYGIDNPQNYLNYLECLRQLIQTTGFVDFYSVVSRNFDYEITAMRALEIVMFETDRSNQISKRNALG